MMLLDCPAHLDQQGATRWNPGASVASGTALLVGPDLPCRQDPELFFAESPQDIEQAKALCQGCRVRMACLTGALGRGEPWGVWGGELLIAGVIVAHKRPRGRPRKIDVAA
jgi:WhiB family redox-sensing transcriptional regulator